MSGVKKRVLTIPKIQIGENPRILGSARFLVIPEACPQQACQILDSSIYLFRSCAECLNRADVYGDHRMGRERLLKPVVGRDQLSLEPNG